MLVPQWGFQNASERRMRLLRMRNELLKMGTDAEDLDEELTLGSIRQATWHLQAPLRAQSLCSIILRIARPFVHLSQMVTQLHKNIARPWLINTVDR